MHKIMRLRHCSVTFGRGSLQQHEFGGEYMDPAKFDFCVSVPCPRPRGPWAVGCECGASAMIYAKRLLSFLSRCAVDPGLRRDFYTW
jgi:hypothetical protein